MQGGEWKGRRRPNRFRRFRWERLALIALSAALIAFGLVKLIGYGVDWMASRQTAQELRAVYYADPTPAPIAATAAPTEAPAPVPAQSAIPRLPAARSSFP